MDSPLTLLTQDMAKSFLATADEGKLYDVSLHSGEPSLISVLPRRLIPQTTFQSVPGD